jgi:hypothetical protein
MVHYYPNDAKTSLNNDSGTDNDEIDSRDLDPGREVIERNMKNRAKRIADNTKEELDKVLKRVDNVKTNSSKIVSFFNSPRQ